MLEHFWLEQRDNKNVIILLCKYISAVITTTLCEYVSCWRPLYSGSQVSEAPQILSSLVYQTPASVVSLQLM